MIETRGITIRDTYQSLAATLKGRMRKYEVW